MVKYSNDPTAAMQVQKQEKEDSMKRKETKMNVESGTKKQPAHPVNH
jgi:hypothetical protein